jgi:hypothetical protein
MSDQVEVVAADTETSLAEVDASTQPTDGKLLSAEEYAAKAEALEAKLKRIEGRENKEFNLHNWFVEQDSAVTVQKLANKGMGFVIMLCCCARVMFHDQPFFS